MSLDRLVPERVPVLTEVIELADDEAARPAPESAPDDVHAAVAPLPDLSDPPALASVPAAGDPPGPTVPAQAPVPEPRAEPYDAEEIARAVMLRLDLQLEARLREALAPALARAADTLIREAREDLAATVREAVEAALRRELGQRRGD